MSSTEEQAVQAVIDQIWEKYDINKRGALDKEETKKFVIDTLGNLGSGDDFSDEAFDAVVQWVQTVLRNVRPKRTRLTIETTPWTPIDSAQSYQRLLQAVNDEALAVHLDPVNLITDAHRYYRTTELLNECFDLFGPKIIACHAKDILQGDPKTVNLTEVAPGEGVLDYNTFLKRARQLSSDLPIVIEHLDTELQYANAAAHLQRKDNLSTSENNQ